MARHVYVGTYTEMRLYHNLKNKRCTCVYMSYVQKEKGRTKNMKALFRFEFWNNILPIIVKLTWLEIVSVNYYRMSIPNVYLTHIINKLKEVQVICLAFFPFQYFRWMCTCGRNRIDLFGKKCLTANRLQWQGDR